MSETLSEAVHDAIERIVENELHGLPSWRMELTNRLTAAALAATEKSLDDAIEYLNTYGEGNPDRWPTPAEILRAPTDDIRSK